MSMTSLRQRMTENMELRGLAPKTQKAYIYVASKRAKFYNKSLDLLTSEEVRAFLLHLVQVRKTPANSFRQLENHSNQIMTPEKGSDFWRGVGQPETGGSNVFHLYPND